MARKAKNQIGFDWDTGGALLPPGVPPPPSPAVVRVQSYREGLVEQIKRDTDTLRHADDHLLNDWDRAFYAGRIAQYRAAVLKLDAEAQAIYDAAIPF